MKKIGTLLLCTVLLLSLTACSIGDVAYYQGMRQLKQGNYAKAYEHLRASTSATAAEVLENFAFVPLTHTYRDANQRSELAYTYTDEGYPIKVETSLTWKNGTTAVRTQTLVYEGAVKKEHRWHSTDDYGTASSVHTYNEQGKPVYEAFYSDGTLFAEHHYVYDAAGRQLSYKETGEESDSIESTYDKQGRLLTENVVGQGIIYNSTFVYAEDGSYVKNTAADSGDEQWRTQINYDAAGRVIRSHEIPVGAADADETRLEEHRYDGAGNEVYRYTKWGTTVRTTTSKYNEQNLLTYEKTLNGDGTIFSVVKYTYNEDGKVLTRDYSNTGITWRKDTYTYVEGKLVKEHHTDPEIGVTRTVIYTYNEDGTLKMAEEQGSEGSVYSSYGYDEWGNRTQSLIQSGLEETTATATWELHYYPDGVPEDVTQWINDMMMG